MTWKKNKKKFNSTKITVKIEQKWTEYQCSPEILYLDNSSKKANFEKIFLMSNSTVDELFNDTLTFIYDEYIDRPKLSEHKKPFEYIVPPPQVGSEQ